MLSDKPIYTGASAVYPYSKKLERKFTFESRFGDRVELFSNLDGHIFLPRAACPVSDDDRRLDGSRIHIESYVVPRSPEQTRVIHECHKYLYDGQSFIFQARTGFGKTVIACDLISKIGRKTLVILPKEDLLAQWSKLLLKLTDLTPDRIGLIRQDTCDIKGKDVVLGMLHSLAIENRYPEEIRNEFGLVIWDEVHRLGAETFSRTASMFPAKLRLGMSATPRRKDGKDRVFLSHIGGVLVRSEAVPMIPKVFVYHSSWKCPPIPHEPGKVMHILTRMANDPIRNQLLSQLIKHCWDKQRNLVVFSELRAHLETLKIMSLQQGVPEEDIGFYVGGMKEEERNKSIGKPVVLATYRMVSEGTDVEWWDTCLLATPRSDVEQIIGRVLREYPDKPVPVVLDVVDKSSHVFGLYWRVRARLYSRIGAKATMMSI